MLGEQVIAVHLSVEALVRVVIARAVPLVVVIEVVVQSV
jgi:hypothetical protein